MFSITKGLTPEDRKKLSNAYNELTKMEVKYIQTDLVFKEELESQFIKEGFKLWQKIKMEAFDIFENLGLKQEEKKDTGNNNKGYFG